MHDEVTARLIDLRTQIDHVESEALSAQDEALTKKVQELIALHNEMCDVYLREKERYHSLDHLSGGEEDMLNAIEETLEAAQETTLLMIDELRRAQPDHSDAPEIIAFEETVEQMRDEVESYAHGLDIE